MTPDPKVIISKAIKGDHEVLTEITKNSKLFWGYSKEQIEIWNTELTITQEYLEQTETYILSIANCYIGYYSFLKMNPNELHLDNMFILPEYIGKGYGKILIEDLVDKAKSLGVSKIILDAEPNAEKFYEKYGFEVVGKRGSSIKNRYLPIMEKILDPKDKFH
ncbi:MAG: GNAT family N-acetyltransferase [Bacteroidota bacterium]|nr:GNAT family N-acetyltransferase [Bacteroidota bacterium]